MFKDPISIEKMKYKKDKSSANLAIIGLALNVIYFFTMYKNNNNYYFNLSIGMSVLYNLVFMLAAFLTSEKLKAYEKAFSYTAIVLGVLQLVRIFNYPLDAYQATFLAKKSFIICVTCLSLSGISLITAGVCSYIKSTVLHKFLAEEKAK